MDEERLIKIETNMVYIQDTMDSLNKMVAEQTMEIEKLRNVIEVLSKRLEEIEGEDRPNRKPPHY